MFEKRITAILLGLGVSLRRLMAQELISQGHRATGDLIDSIDSEVNNILDGLRMSLSMNTYGIFVDAGRKPGTRRVPIDAIEAWLRQRNFDWARENPRGAAFAVQTTIFRKGIKPSGFIDKAIKAITPEAFEKITDVAIEQVGLQIDNLVKETNTKIITAKVA